jgi:hypothetical protein
VGKETLADVSRVAVIVNKVSVSEMEDGLKKADIKALVEKKAR